MDRAGFLKAAAGAGALLFLPDLSATGQAVSAGDIPITATPVKEGATLRAISGERLIGVVDVGFLRVVTESTPLLYKATRDMRQAFNPKLEWIAPTRFGHRAEFNYTQIFRTPFGISNAEISSLRYGPEASDKLIKLRKKALADHLTTIENVIANGRRAEVRGNYPIRQMGGVKDFKGKTLRLHVLRDLTLLGNRQPNDSDSYEEEFLSEVTLQVTK